MINNVPGRLIGIVKKKVFIRGGVSIETRWPALKIEEVCRQLDVDPREGLSGRQVEDLRSRWGKNNFQKESSRSLLSIFVSQFSDFLILVLLGATLVSGLLGEYVDGITILAILFLNAVLGTFQEFRAESSLKALQELAAPRSTVLREGYVSDISSDELVPGDVVALQPGDKIGADLRLLEARGLLVNEAPLTGESVPAEKSSSTMHYTPSSPGDAFNMAYGGTMVVEGGARGVVVATGSQSQLGQIAHLIRQAQPDPTPLQKRLERLGRILVFACMAVCFLVVLLGLWRGEGIYGMFMAGVSLAVAAIPEGLPAIVTVSLALGVQRMIRRRAIVRQLPAVETLGSATVICSDKTGTLTENKMVLRQVYSGEELYLRGEDGKWENRGGNKIKPRSEKALSLALEIGALCNNASPAGRTSRRNGHGQGYSHFRGDPTEVALAEAGREAGIKEKDGRLYEFTFSPERKMMSVVVEGNPRLVLAKGAPDVLLRRCNYIYRGGRVQPMKAEERNKILNAVETMAGTSLRSLGMAYRELSNGKVPGTAEEAEKDLVWVGLVGMEDPPRPQVRSSVQLCHRAGIKVVMITGDHRGTAVSIARRLEIMRRGEALTGEELDGLDDTELEKKIDRVQVFARVNPEHKLRIVRALKKKGHVVAMTGDGVNDAPAVKEADIGIAMGSTGTEVTKEAASLVLEDDNFNTIVAAVEEGRNIYANIRKFIRFLLGCNSGEIMAILLSLLIGLPLPLRPIQILWVNLVTDGLPALALGAEPPDRQIMEQPPRKKEEGLFNGGTWARLVAKGFLIGSATVAVFALMLQNSGDLVLAQTTALTTLVVSQLVFVFDCRSEKPYFWMARLKPNLYLYLAVLVSFLLMLMVVYVGFWQGIFQTTTLTLHHWIYVVAFSFLPFLVSWGRQGK